MSQARITLASVVLAGAALTTTSVHAIEGCVMVHPIGWVGTDHQNQSGMAEFMGTTCQWEARLVGDIIAVGTDWRVTIARPCAPTSADETDCVPNDPNNLSEGGTTTIVHTGEPVYLELEAIQPFDRVTCQVLAPGTILGCGNATTP